MNELGFLDGIYESDYEQYADLLCKRDQLYKESSSILIAYTKEFGDLITQNFEKKIECIKLKKMIAFCQAKINRGESVDVQKMNDTIEQELTMYYQELQDMVATNKAAKDSVTIDEIRVSRSKKIYRRLAKKLHPDVNEKTHSNEKLRELWDRIVKAYRESDTEELENLEVLTKRVLEELGDDGIEIKLESLKERIERITKEINEILSTEPYIYREILEDEERIEKRKEELKAEQKEFRKYQTELTEVLDNLIGGGGFNVVWRMN